MTSVGRAERGADRVIGLSPSQSFARLGGLSLVGMSATDKVVDAWHCHSRQKWYMSFPTAAHMASTRIAAN